MLSALSAAGSSESAASPAPHVTLAAPAAAAAPSCKTDWDCQLNGACLPTGDCQCDAAWNGTDCGKLRLEPGSIVYGCWPSATNLTCDVTSWGGGPPVQDPITRKWVFFVSEIAGHCGLKPWNYMSQIVKTVARQCPLLVSVIQKGTRALISLWDSLMFGRVPEH